MGKFLQTMNVRGSTSLWARYATKIALAAAALLISPAMHAQISGTKTVCSSGCDYSSITNAVNDLKSKGVNGATTISIKKGSYNEQVNVTGISGLSSTNTLKFVGAGTVPGDVYVYYNLSGSYTYVWTINSLSYVTVENMMIANTGSSGYTAALYLNYATYCTIKNNTVKSMESSSAPYAMSAARTDNSSYCTFDGNMFRGGYTCFDKYNGFSYNNNNVYKNNHFKKYVQYGLQIYYGDANEYNGNIVDSAQITTPYAVYSYYETNAKYIGNEIHSGYYGLYTYTGTTGTGFEIKNNNIQMEGTYGYYGLMIQGYASYDITNNMINMTTSNGQMGIYLSANASTGAVYKVIHNTIRMVSGNYCIYLYAYNAPQLDVRNNIFAHTGSGLTMYYQNNSTTGARINPNTKLDGNTHYNTGGNIVYIYMGSSGTNYNSMTAYKAAMANYGNYAQNDLFMAPTFSSTTNLHLNQSTVAPYAKTISTVTKDIDGDNRSCAYFVTAGADESTYSGNLHLAKPSAPKFTGPTTGIDGIFYSYVNSGTIGPFVYQWYVDGKLQKDSAHLRVAMATGTHTVKLVAVNCGGKDSSQISVTISDPAAKPTSDFISNVNIINAGDTVKFADGSSGDPSSWTWSVSPATALDGSGNVVPSYKVVYGSLTTDAPWIQFLYAGNYKICLSTANKKGAGNTECKSAYIEVKPLYYMGKVSVIKDSAATFYDDGGKNDFPKRQGKTTILIDPCASDVWLTISKFDMMCGYNYLRIYDGDKEDVSKLLHTNCTGASPYYPASTGFTGGVTYPYCPSTSTNCQPKLSTSSAPDTFHAKSGRMLIVQDINYSYYNYGQGFEASYRSKPKAMNIPVAKFSSSVDTICTNGSVNFTNQSTGANVEYLWDTDGDIESFEGTSQNISWPYFFEGSVTISLIAKNCGGSDTFSKSIYVKNPDAPTTAFVADNTNPTISDIVFFSADMKECIDDYKWTFTSASGKGQAIFMNGTKATSPKPQVVFSDTGCYSVSLYTKNVTGEDSLKRNCYIRVKGAYCVPSVGTLSGDLGISKVTFNTISNTSSQGTTPYQNFVPVQTQSTTVETGVTYKLTVERSTNKNKATRQVWIDWNGDGDFNDNLELVAQEINAQTLSWKTDITIPTIAKTGATIMRISVDLGSQTPAACGPNKFGEVEDYRLYVRPDLTKPVITLIGKDTITMEQGYTYTDEGATAEDNLDGDITSDIVVTLPDAGYNLVPGTYKYIYNVKDGAGNDAKSVVRYVIVTPDATAPELIVMKPDTILLQVNSVFNAPVVLKAEDLVDGDVSGAVSITNDVKSNEVGDYTVTYTVSDVTGNKATVTRLVRVIDTIMPVMNLVGSSTVFHEAGTTYNDSGVTVSDNYYSEAVLRSGLTMQNNVNTNKLGTYTVVYVLVDPFTNKTITVTRTVEVVDTQKPSVALNGADVVDLDVFGTYIEAGVTMSDNFDMNPTLTKTGTFYAAFPTGRATKLGSYTIIYTVNDEAGNNVSTTRTINVVDRVAPTALLKGSGYVSICRWATYNDEGVTVKDNYDSTNKLTITQEGTFFFTMTSVEGIYNFRYKVVDQSGNIGYSEYRNIYVRNPYESPCSTNVGVTEIDLAKRINVYPNPNTGKFTVEANLAATEQVRISVTNLMGQEIAVISNGSLSNTTFQVDLSNQASGVYMLNITTSKQSVTKRIVVNK